MLTATRRGAQATQAEPAPLASWRRRRRMNGIAAVVLPVILAVAGAVAWQVAATAATGGSVLIPTFTDFAGAVVRLLASSAFWSAMWTSQSALVVGFAIAVAVGVPLGLYVGRHKTLDGLLSGYLDIAVVTPTAVFMPLV